MFVDFKNAVAKQFDKMKAHGLYRVQLDKDQLWDTYLGSFPEGTNPVYKERTEYDCQCCKSFIRSVGGVVAIIDGEIVSLWDIEVAGYYQVVADALAALVYRSPIDNVFLNIEKTAGTDKSHQQTEAGVLSWDHFFLTLPGKYVVPGEKIGPKLADSRSTRDVMIRGLNEITMDSIDTVLDLIAQNSLYRGEEHKFAVESFRELKQKFDQDPHPAVQEIFCWSRLDLPQSVSRIRGTVIGTLLVDLSEGKELEYAVKAFEAKVAPTNYKRPTALVTKAMIQKAQAQIEELGFTSALERRYATIEDITINNILHANRESKKAMNVFDELTSSIPEKVQSLDKIEEVTIDNFIANILPKAESLEVLFENRHSSNLMSLVAPVDPTSKTMFKWDNNFSWSYAGEVTDSIKERVKKAGGSVEGDLCCRLAWNYTDDLDFHMTEPGKGHIYFGNRRQKSSNGGELDLDANGTDGQVSDPAENIFYSTKRTMRDGIYTLSVNNYNRRSSGVGFEVEIEFDGQIHRMVYEKALPTGNTVEVAQISYTRENGFKIVSSLPSSQASKTVWGIPTQTFRKVNVVMHSPNYWDDRTVGNKHFFFMLDGCLNDGKARGFFNEFLTEELNAHRKVIEVVGAKMKTEESSRQLSGIGFSSTQRNHILCRVKGSFARTIKITF